MATNRCATAKAPQVGLTSGPTQFGDEPVQISKLDGYKLNIRSLESRADHFGGSVDITYTLEISTTARSIPASESMQNFEEFLNDTEVLSKIKKSKNPGVKDLWGQLQTLLTLSEE